MNRALSILLFVISALQGLAGLTLLFASGWIAATAFPLFGLAKAGLVFALIKAIGVIVLAFGYLTCCAARNPVRYVAVIDALIFLAFAAAALNLYTIAVLGVPAPYVTYLAIRTAIQLVLAILLLVLRPRAAGAA